MYDEELVIHKDKHAAWHTVTPSALCMPPCDPLGITINCLACTSLFVPTSPYPPRLHVFFCTASWRSGKRKV